MTVQPSTESAACFTIETDNSTARDYDQSSASHWLVALIGADRFRHCLRNREKRVEDAKLSRKRSLQTIGAKAKRTDFALAA